MNEWMRRSWCSVGCGGWRAQFLAAAMFVAGRPLVAQNVMLDLPSPANLPDARATDVSDDGQRIVGFAGPNAVGPYVAVEWSGTSTVAPMGLATGRVPIALARSANAFCGSRPYQGDGFRVLDGTSAFIAGRGEAISDDGQTVVGVRLASGASGSSAFRWTASGGLVVLDSLIGAVGSPNVAEAKALSGDGSIVAGFIYHNGSSFTDAFRFDATSGVVQLLNPPSVSAYAGAMSRDGSQIFGTMGSGVMFRWSASSGLQSLGAPSGATALQVIEASDDGSVVVGHLLLPGSNNFQPFRWSFSTGFQVHVVAANATVHGMSPNGAFVVGQIVYPQMPARGFVWGPDLNANGVIDGYEGPICAIPTTYCTSKVNSQLCAPAIDISGPPSASGGSACLVTASNMLNNRTGLLLYSYQASATSFQGGYLCVAAPRRRTPVQASGGSPTGSDCSGAYSFDFTAYITSGIDPQLQVVGQSFACQYWARDPQDAWGSSLTDAVYGVVCQ